MLLVLSCFFSNVNSKLQNISFAFCHFHSGYLVPQQQQWHLNNFWHQNHGTFSMFSSFLIYALQCSSNFEVLRFFPLVDSTFLHMCKFNVLLSSFSIKFKKLRLLHFVTIYVFHKVGIFITTYSAIIFFFKSRTVRSLVYYFCIQ